jgi:hypothetical protein
MRAGRGFSGSRPRFTIGEREGYRDLYAGALGAFRNPSAHRLIDPTPHDGGVYLVERNPRTTNHASFHANASDNA